MKRSISRAMVLCAFLTSILISSLFAAEITFVKGKAQVQKSGSSEWMPAEIGMQVAIGDRIQTARKSKVDLMLDDQKKNTIRIDQNTMVVLNSTVTGEMNRFDVSQGTIYAKLDNVKSGLTYEIASPSSVAGVRGTGWKNDIQRDRDEFSCFEREIYVQTYDQNHNLLSESIIPEGFKALVDRFAAASPLIELTTQERSDWNETRADVSSRIEQKEEKEQQREDKAKEQAQDQGPADQIANIADQAENIQDATVNEVAQTKEIQEERTSEKTLDEVVKESGAYGH